MKVITFGEIMLRLAPQGYYRFSQAHCYESTFGGGEANVAVSLTNFGIPCSFVTKLPTNDIAQCAINELRGLGVDTAYICRGGERLGIYYLEKGASQRASQVIYDRSNSSISTANNTDFNWGEIFKNADWFHFTGITPALSASMAQICLEACTAAKQAGCTISCDLNYRGKLWSKAKANIVMSKLMKYVDVCIANEEDASDVFDIRAYQSDVTSGKLNKESYIEVAKELTKRFQCRAVAITLRESISANDNRWGAMLYTNHTAYFSKKYDLHIVDRVGGGDSFGAGLIYSFLNHLESQDTIEFAVAASCLKHSIEGDFNRISVQEVETLANGDGSGRVQR